jgi:hypothetical protein
MMMQRASLELKEISMKFLQNVCILIVTTCIFIVLCLMMLDAWDKEYEMREKRAQQYQQRTP